MRFFSFEAGRGCLFRRARGVLAAGAGLFAAGAGALGADPAASVCRIGSYPERRAGWHFEMQSSYDRTGGNDDGFNGTWSALRLEGGDAVVAETRGAGMITRIWFPYDSGWPNAPMFLAGRRIRIYLDGEKTPRIDLPAADLFNGRSPLFFNPLCNIALGGCYCLLPIPFSDGAKVVVQGGRAGFVQVQFTKFDKPSGGPSFDGGKGLFDAGARAAAIRRFWHDGREAGLELSGPVEREAACGFGAGWNRIAFPKGPLTLRAFTVRAGDDDLRRFLRGRLRIAWDGEKTPAVDIPLSLFFLWEEYGATGRSWLAGLSPGGGGVYNFIPMPYRREADVRVFLPGPCRAVVRTVFEKGPPRGAHLHTAYNKEGRTTPGRRYRWLDVKGAGHYIGLCLRVAGVSLHDAGAGHSWTACLEGDEMFVVDGRAVSHGTGTEDYFNAGWNGMFGRLDHAQMLPFNGYTRYDCTAARSYTAAYRWHLPTEVVPFEKSLEASVEVGPADNLSGSYESAAYYYLFE